MPAVLLKNTICFFTPAQAELSLNKCKNSHLLTVETEIKAENKGSLVANSIEFARRLKTTASVTVLYK